MNLKHNAMPAWRKKENIMLVVPRAQNESLRNNSVTFASQSHLNAGTILKGMIA
jgi:hypothetical protein